MGKIEGLNPDGLKYEGLSKVKEAIDFGLDVTLLYKTLSLTPTERLEYHQRMLGFAEEMRKAGERKHGKR